MAPSPPIPSRDEFADPREIAKWTSRYAKSRTIPFLVQWVFIVFLALVIAGVVFLTLKAYRSEDTVWFLLCAAGIVGMLVALVWFVVPHWGGERIYQVSQWVYGEEGYASYLGGDPEEDIKAAWWIYVAAAGLAIYHFVGALLITRHPQWLGYMQPYSALYMVPFFIAMTYSQRLGFWAYIWPALFGVHAVVVLLGDPGRYAHAHPEIFDMIAYHMILPVFGYGLVAILVGHVYSRYALHRLKAAVRKGLDINADVPEEEA